jgi:hypothetical protein
LTEDIDENDDQALDFISEAIKQKNILQKRCIKESSFLSGLDELEDEPLKKLKEAEIIIESPKPVQPKKKEGKRVTFHVDIESIKFFKLTDLPIVNGLSNE